LIEAIHSGTLVTLTVSR